MPPPQPRIELYVRYTLKLFYRSYIIGKEFASKCIEMRNDSDRSAENEKAHIG